MKRLLLLAGATVASLVLAEGILTLVAAHHDLPGSVELRWIRDRDAADPDAYVLDPAFGFRPRLGTSLMNQYGTRPNEYALAKPAGRQRLLFVGDSVTFRGRIIRALRDLYGEERYEYWNAGVESFDTCQEVAYYRMCNAPIRPDHVIVSFHNNDFEAVPVAFRQNGKLVVYSGASGARLSPWLYHHSRLYRSLAGFSGLAAAGFRVPSASAVRETGRCLAELKESLDRDGIRLTVILLPVFKPGPDWTRGERRSREEAIRVFGELGIRCIDLLPALETAVARGVPLQETPGDPWHPSGGLARIFGEFLRDHDLLEQPAGAGQGGQHA